MTVHTSARADVLTVADVARLRGVGRVAAYRWLQRNASPYLRRDGRFVVIDAKAYAALVASPLARHEQRIEALESRVDELERRFDASVRRAS